MHDRAPRRRPSLRIATHQTTAAEGVNGCERRQVSLAVAAAYVSRRAQ
jgi:hypothetical protein